MAPRQSRDTFSPVDPRLTYSIRTIKPFRKQGAREFVAFGRIGVVCGPGLYFAADVRPDYVILTKKAQREFSVFLRESPASAVNLIPVQVFGPVFWRIGFQPLARLFQSWTGG